MSFSQIFCLTFEPVSAILFVVSFDPHTSRFSKKLSNELNEIKNVLSTHKQSVYLLDDLPLEKGIVGVIRRVKKLGEKELSNASLDPKEIKQKLSPSQDMALYIAVNSYVTTYFRRIKEIMMNLDKRGEIDYDEIQDQIHAFYIRPTSPESNADGHGHWLAIEIDGTYQMLSWRHPAYEGGQQEYGRGRRSNALSDLESDISAKEAICSQAENLSLSQEWSSASSIFNQLFDEWKKVYNWGTPKEKQLWERFQAAKKTSFNI